MNTSRHRVSPGRRERPGLNSAPAPIPGYRACDDESLIIPGTIYAFPTWEIHAETGMIILYEADPATGQLTLDRAGKPVPVAQVPSVLLARAEAKPRIVWDYVGQTIRELEVREAEHIADKCWEDVIAGHPIVLEAGRWDKKTRDGREHAAIARLRPRFNKDDNEANLARIEIWRQVELRHARDDALHRARWLPLEQRSAAAQQAARLAVVGAGLDGNEPKYPLTLAGDLLAEVGRWFWARSRRTKITILLLAGWAGAALVAARLLIGHGCPARYAYPVAVVAASVGLGATRRRRRKRRRR